ncbi:hypothetical protein ACFHYQ_14405 [Sphaerimonospora cavernae]|uniref:Lipoprotein n=1 Tax=Sphaerimonospora cavernae TaxID=1740611 RepID=A0ABV6U638_9ACTN
MWAEDGSGQTLETKTMPVMPHRVRLHIAAVAVLTLLAASACTSDESPTAAKAGQAIKKHILQLLKERNAQNVTITDPGGKNIPCGDDKAKQTFAARATDADPQAQPQIIKDTLVAALRRVAPYEIISDKFDARPIELRNAEEATVLFLGSPGEGRIDVRGETRCLTAD